MIRLFDGVYLLDGTVGTRPIYLPLLVGPYGALLLDSGCSYHVDGLILPALRELGVASLRYLVNTHPDSDHVGGNAGIRRFSPDVTLACGDADRDQVEDPAVLFARRYDAYRPYGVFYADEVRAGILRDLGEAQPVDLTFRGGERLRLGPDWDLEILALPGHSKGHLGLWDHRNDALYGGDAIQGALYTGIDGRPALCPTYLYPETYLQTARFVEKLRPGTYVSCHWPVKQGAEVAEFCEETRRFVDRAATLIAASPSHDLKELLHTVGPQLGEWPAPVNSELAYAFAGHLGLQ